VSQLNSVKLPTIIILLLASTLLLKYNMTSNNNVINNLKCVRAKPSPERLLEVKEIYAVPNKLKPGMRSTLYYTFEALDNGYVDKYILYIYVDTPYGLRLIASEVLLEGEEVGRGQRWSGQTSFTIPYDSLSGPVIAIFYYKVSWVILKVTELPSNVEIFSVARIEIEEAKEWKEKYSELKSKYDDLLSKYSNLLSKYNELSMKYDSLSSRYNELLIKYNDILRKYEESKGQLTIIPMYQIALVIMAALMPIIALLTHFLTKKAVK